MQPTRNTLMNQYTVQKSSPKNQGKITTQDPLGQKTNDLGTLEEEEIE